MTAEDSTEPGATMLALSPAEIEAILRERGWRTGGAGPELEAWLQQAAALLSPQAADRETLADLLGLVFHYDAREILQSPESHAILAREGARNVIRELAPLVLAGGAMDSDRFKQVVDALKEKLRYRGRELFYPMRLALAGRGGEGALDRVILLADGAAQAPGLAPVKTISTRMLEFIAVLK